jgi:hypothetical protein
VSHIIEGKFFYTVRDGELEYQGQIIGMVGPTHVLVQYYEWIFGTPSNQATVAVSDTVTWRLFEDPEDWHRAMQRFGAHKSPLTELSTER